MVEMTLYDCYRLTQQYDKAIKGYEALLKKMPSNGLYEVDNEIIKE